jgi:uncharacterized membrane protein YoaK (UPF0700 family)
MLIHEGAERTVQVDLRLASILAMVAGAINTAGFQAAGYYSANMTGNVSALSQYIAFGNPLALLYAGIVVIFVLGAFVSAQLISFGSRHNVRGVYAFSILLEGVLLAAVAAADIAVPGMHRGIVLVLSLSFLMGLQNAAATRISNARVRTTHVSGMATDLGIELAAIIDMALGRQTPNDTVRANAGLHAATIGAFIVGGIIGAAGYAWIGGGLLLLAALVLLAVAAPAFLTARR